ncbi:unnamed protein product [Schistocephalus solidus]|uniref:DUF4773 domain-containing protein n=1 Tax=Schistocephalus solidus TaxID=70667 RepID=A0A183T2I8_SCHSO|nr:unnamed protein product [Schistocephalus solidus]
MRTETTFSTKNNFLSEAEFFHLHLHATFVHSQPTYFQCPSQDDEALRYRSGIEGENKCRNQTDCMNVDVDCVTCMNSVQRVAGWLNSTYIRWVTHIFIHNLCRVSANSVCEADMWALIDKATDNIINGPYAVRICRHGVDAEDSSPLQAFRVRDPVLPSQLQYSAEAAEMKVIQLPGLVRVDGPGLRSVKE